MPLTIDYWQSTTPVRRCDTKLTGVLSLPPRDYDYKIYVQAQTFPVERYLVCGFHINRALTLKSFPLETNQIITVAYRTEYTGVVRYLLPGPLTSFYFPAKTIIGFEPYKGQTLHAENQPLLFEFWNTVKYPAGSYYAGLQKDAVSLATSLKYLRHNFEELSSVEIPCESFMCNDLKYPINDNGVFEFPIRYGIGTLGYEDSLVDPSIVPSLPDIPPIPPSFQNKADSTLITADDAILTVDSEL